MDLVKAPIDFVLKPNLFDPERVIKGFPEGMTIRAMIDASDFDFPDSIRFVCYLNDEEIEEKDWGRVCPKEGDLVQVMAPLMGGQPGSGRQLFGQFFVIAASGFANALVPGSGIFVAAFGSAIVNSLVKPPKPENRDIVETTTVTSQQNQILRNGIVPKIYGRMRVSPPHGALPFTERQGNDLFLRMLLCPGQGPLKISDIRVGKTPISSLGTDFEVEIREGRPTDAPLTLYSNDVFEDSPNIELNFADGPSVRRSQVNADEITVDLTWPEGLFRVNKKGKTKSTYAEANIEFKRAEDPNSAYQSIFVDGKVGLKLKHRGLLRRSFRIRPPVQSATGEYDVRVRRTNADEADGSRTVNSFAWTAIRSIRHIDPFPDPNLAKIAIRIKRDGPVENINCICESYVQDYQTGVGWTERVSNNPAAIYRDILTGDGSARPINIARIREAEDLEPWHDYCRAQGFTFNGVFDSSGTVKQRLDLVAQSGRAAFSIPDGRYGVIIDELKTTPVALFTPRNSFGFRGTRDFVKPLHAARVAFINAGNDFQEDEIIVYADGQNSVNSDPDRIEFLDLRRAGVTNADLAWRHGRFFIAGSQLRQERWQLSVGLDSLVVTRGDLVRLQHDVLLIGSIPGARVKSRTTNAGGDVTSITVDEICTMAAGNNYAVRARVIDVAGQPQVVFAPVDLNIGDQTTLTFTTPVSSSQAIENGDLVAFGVAGVETQEAIISAITPGPDFTAKLTLVDSAPGIHTSDTGAIPPFVSNITLPGGFFGTPPAAPVIDRVYLQAVNTPVQPDPVHSRGFIIALDKPSTREQPPEAYQVRIRLVGALDFTERHAFPGDSVELTIPAVPVDNDYELQVRAVGRSPAGVPNESAWSSLETISVPIPANTTVDLPEIVGLELFDQAHDTQFSGQNPTFVWRLTAGLGSFSFENEGEVEAFSDPALSFYEITIRNADDSTVIRREVLVRVPEYTYSYERNLEDAKRLNIQNGLPVLPRRDFIFEVKIVDTFGREGPVSRLRVSNPSPAAPTGLQALPGSGQVFVTANTPQDADFLGIKVWASTTSGFTPNVATEVASDNQSNITFPAIGGQALFVRAAFFDVFGQDIAELNISSEVRVDVPATTEIPDFKFSGILFTPNSPGNDQVSWTAGEAVTLVGGSATTDTVAAGTASFAGQTVYLYYVAESGQILDTIDPNAAAASNARVLAIYRGGTQLSQGNGDVIIDGSTIAAGTILGQQIAAGVITGDLLAGENLIVNSAQIGNLTVETSNIASDAVNVISIAQEQSFISGIDQENRWRTVIGKTVVINSGSKVRLDFSFIADFEEFNLPTEGSASIEVLVRVLRNSKIIKGPVRVATLTVTEDSPDDRARQLVSFADLDQPTAGTHRYIIQISLLGTPISGNGLSAFDRNVFITEIKK